MSDYLYECSVCHKQVVTEKAATIGDDHCCMTCANDHNHPGKFGTYSSSDPNYFDHERMGKALLLYEFSLDHSYLDDHMSNEGWGYCARIDEFLVYEDTQGFVTFEEFEDAAKAEKEFNDLYMMGWGAGETDIYVGLDRGRWRAYDGDSGKEIEVWARSGHEYDDYAGIDRSRILAAVRLHCFKTGYYPNVWEDNERGTLIHIGEEIW